jgi:PAS domain S-box-containing protein
MTDQPLPNGVRPTDQRLLQTILDTMPAVVFAVDGEGRIVYANQLWFFAVGLTPEQALGKSVKEFFPPEVSAGYLELVNTVLTTGEPLSYEDPRPVGDEIRTFASTLTPLRDEHGTAYAACGISIDITDRKRAESERDTLQQQIIEAQQAELAVLSTPLIPIADDVLIMPLIGMINDRRATLVMETLLEGVAAHGARIVILDITGVNVVDTPVANSFIQVARAVQLLGAQIVMTGISGIP